jgi:hypothetical protein
MRLKKCSPTQQIHDTHTGKPTSVLKRDSVKANEVRSSRSIHFYLRQFMGDDGLAALKLIWIYNFLNI